MLAGFCIYESAFRLLTTPTYNAYIPSKQSIRIPLDNTGISQPADTSRHPSLDLATHWSLEPARVTTSRPCTRLLLNLSLPHRVMQSAVQPTSLPPPVLAGAVLHALFPGSRGDTRLSQCITF